MDPVWSPIRPTGSLTDRIVERIESIISSEGLPVGARLPPERDLARMLAVSRPALREAVKRLEAHGRLVVRHGQGVFVGEGRRDPVQDYFADMEVNLAGLFAMREVLEEPAAAWAASSVTPDDIESVDRALARLDEEVTKETVDFRRLAQLDAAFHLQIAALSKNEFMSRTLGLLQEILSKGMETTLTIPGRLERSRRDHQAIVEAIRRGDPEAARHAAVAHIHGARDAALDRVEAERSQAKRSRQNAP